MSVLFGGTHAASVALLNRAGYDVLLPHGQGCCGALHAHGGNLRKARGCARRNLTAFAGVQLDAVVINAAGCGSTLKEYGDLLGDDREWSARAQAFSSQVKDLSEILASGQFQPGRRTHVGLPGDVQVGPGAGRHGSGSVTIQDACHLAHAQRITRAPRDLIQAVAGEAYVEMPESDVCCGSAGSYNLTEPRMAARLRRRKVANILHSGATTVVTTNPGCLLQMRAGLEEAGAGHVRVMHLADFLHNLEIGSSSK
jgi:glycolate oxidase iron-sulfur subunit